MDKRAKRIIGTVMVGALMVGTPVLASEEEHAHEGPHEFHETMEELGEWTEGIVDAINHENWPRVAELAQSIADHPKPPADERRQLHEFAGDRLDEFQRYDRGAHEMAADVARFAEAGEGRYVISAFADLQNRCLDCHVNFRQDFREHFYAGNR
ncbi:hypothetical protein [Guyparkeria sp.]|uniref:hypothetical protein n=1 Tax=Guyparkeria sp. TaxID=2035736 RepID=UPI0039709C87